MAEVPEIETLRRDLDREVGGKRIKTVEVPGSGSIPRHTNKKQFAGLLEEVYDTLLRQRPSAGDSPFHIVLGCHDSDREICCATERSRLAGRPFASTEEQAKELADLGEQSNAPIAKMLAKRSLGGLTDLPAKDYAEVKEVLEDRIRRKADSAKERP